MNLRNKAVDLECHFLCPVQIEIKATTQVYNQMTVQNDLLKNKCKGYKLYCHKHKKNKRFMDMSCPSSKESTITSTVLLHLDLTVHVGRAQKLSGFEGVSVCRTNTTVWRHIRIVDRKTLLKLT